MFRGKGDRKGSGTGGFGGKEGGIGEEGGRCLGGLFFYNVV